MGQTQLSRHDSYSGFYTEHRKSLQDVKGKAQAEGVRKADSTEGCKDDGCCCSSAEVPVMGMERRTADIRFQMMNQLNH